MNSLFNEVVSLSTEQNNPNTKNIDTLSTSDLLKTISVEDSRIVPAVNEEIEHITQGVELIVSAFKKGGRLFYVGAGTSGRLGVVDASECPPTFGVDSELVQGVIAGGDVAMFKAQEGAEDSIEEGKNVINKYHITKSDVICGIAASGRTPFVRGALDAGIESGIPTILVTTNSRVNLLQLGVNADCIIAPQVGPEVIAGSTRMKSGTAQKLVLNMLTTASMIRIGKTYGNIMVDVQPTNAKLKERAKKIIMDLTGCTYEVAQITLIESGYNVKVSLVMLISGVGRAEAVSRLMKADGVVRVALETHS